MHRIGHHIRRFTGGQDRSRQFLRLLAFIALVLAVWWGWDALRPQGPVVMLRSQEDVDAMLAEGNLPANLPFALSAKRADYGIIASQPPFLFRVVADPLDVSGAGKQHLLVGARDPQGVASVVTEVEEDSTISKITLKLISGNATSGFWYGERDVPSAALSRYRLRFLAKNTQSKEASFVVSWPEGAGTLLYKPLGFFEAFKIAEASHSTCSALPLTGNSTISSSCTLSGVDGLDGGTLTVSGTGVQLTIGASATLGFATISIASGGSIAITSGGQISKSNIWMQDSDADTYYNFHNQKAQSASPGAGWTRKNAVGQSSEDCYDANANAKPGQTSYFTTNRGDGSFDYDCNGTEDKEFTTTNTCP